MTQVARKMSDAEAFVDQKPKEFELTATDLEAVAALLFQEAGIRLETSKANMVYSRLSKRLRILGLESFREYLALLSDKSQVVERQHMVEALTTNVTRFFREHHHFDHMRATALPDLLASAKRGGRVRLWSAGCSSGEEAYSIALTLLSVMPEVGSLDVKILATDIDTGVLDKAKRGIYSKSNLEDVPDTVKKKCFSPAPGNDGNSLQIMRDAQKLISFRKLNLFNQWPMQGMFDIIFCRNVTIYFDEPSKSELWTRFANALSPTGFMYIGHSERVTGPTMDAMRTVGTTTYQHCESRPV